MKREDLFQAIGEIDESLLEEKKSRHWHIWTEIAAAVVICSVMLTLAVRILPNDGDIRVWHSSGPEPMQSVPVSTETETETDLTAQFDTLEGLEMQRGSILYLPEGTTLKKDDSDLYITINCLYNVMHIQVLTQDHSRYTDISGYGAMTKDEYGDWNVDIRGSQAFTLTPMDQCCFKIVKCSELYAQYENLIITSAVDNSYPFAGLSAYWANGGISSMEVTRGRTGVLGYEIARYNPDPGYYQAIVNFLEDLPVYQYTDDSVETTCNLTIQTSNGYVVHIGMPDILPYGMGWESESGITMSVDGVGVVTDAQLVADLRSLCFTVIKNSDPVSTKSISSFMSEKETDPQEGIISY